MPQSSVFLPARRGTYVAVGRWARGDVGVRVGTYWLDWGSARVPSGRPAMFLSFVLKSGGTQAGPADTGLPGSGISVFGTIHPDMFPVRVPLGSARPIYRVELAS